VEDLQKATWLIGDVRIVSQVQRMSLIRIPSPCKTYQNSSTH